MRWLVKVEDIANVPDSAVQNSEEFPNVDIILPQGLAKIAEAGCPAIFIRINTTRGQRLARQKVVAGGQSACARFRPQRQP